MKRRRQTIGVTTEKKGLNVSEEPFIETSMMHEYERAAELL